MTAPADDLHRRMDVEPCSCVPMECARVRGREDVADGRRSSVSEGGREQVPPDPAILVCRQDAEVGECEDLAPGERLRDADDRAVIVGNERSPGIRSEQIPVPTLGAVELLVGRGSRGAAGGAEGGVGGEPDPPCCADVVVRHRPDRDRHVVRVLRTARCHRGEGRDRLGGERPFRITIRIRRKDPLCTPDVVRRSPSRLILCGGGRRPAAVPHLTSRLQGYNSTIFSEMSLLATETGSINLGQGFPDEDGPSEILEAVVDAVRSGANQYPPLRGIAPLLAAVADHQHRFYGIDLDPGREILVTAGATEAIAASILALCETGDEVVLFEPYYDSYAACVAMVPERSEASGAVPLVARRSGPFRPRSGAAGSAAHAAHTGDPAQHPTQSDRQSLLPSRARGDR